MVIVTFDQLPGDSGRSPSSVEQPVDPLDRGHRMGGIPVLNRPGHKGNPSAIVGGGQDILISKCKNGHDHLNKAANTTSEQPR
jgi:hypothetical protein